MKFRERDIDEVIRILPRYGIPNAVLIGDNGYELRFAWSDGVRSGDATLSHRGARELLKIALDEQHRRIVIEDNARFYFRKPRVISDEWNGLELEWRDGVSYARCRYAREVVKWLKAWEKDAEE